MIDTISAFVKEFDGSFKALAYGDVDYMVFDKEGKHIAYAVVSKSRQKASRCNSLKIEASRLLKVWSKRFNPLVIWQLDDAIAYIRAERLSGAISMDSNAMDYVVSIDPKKNPVKFVLT